MDRRTVDVYERTAPEYARARRMGDPERVQQLAAAMPPGGLRLDLGCGPGHHLLTLGSPVVAADAARAMLDEVAGRVPSALRVQCDIEALPFRRGAFHGAWASKSLQHIEADLVPMALADLHHATVVGGRVDITVFRGDGTAVSDDAFPGRFFTWWQPADLADLVDGAGFTIDRLTTTAPGGPGGNDHIEVTATRARTLADTVGPGLRLLCCGLNPSVYSADAGVGYARPGNRFWPAMLAAGLATVARDARHLLHVHRVGLTDLVKRATPGADELTTAEYRAGLGRVERLCDRLHPRALCLVGLTGWRAAADRRATVGWQAKLLGNTPVYVMPSTSGRNARTPLAALVAHLRAAADGPPA